MNNIVSIEHRKLLEKAQQFYNIQQYKRAIQILAERIDVFAMRYVEYCFLCINARVQEKDYENAKNECEFLLKNGIDDDNVYYYRGVANYYLGFKDEARIDLNLSFSKGNTFAEIFLMENFK